MVTADLATNVATNSSESPTGDLVLRVLTPQYRGRLLRLHAAKCTIGAAPQCTLRLRARGVRPLHCLILRGARGTYIRRWSPDTALNGHGFHEALLQRGDRLHVGPIALEVVQTAEARRDPTPVLASGGTREIELTREIETLRERLDTATTTQTQLQAQIETLTDELKSESQRLLQQLDHANTTIRKKTAQISALEARFAASEPSGPASTAPAQILQHDGNTPTNAAAPGAAAEAADGVDDTDEQTHGTLVLGAEFQPISPPELTRSADMNDISNSLLPAADGAAGTDECEIADYMQRLLARVSREPATTTGQDASESTVPALPEPPAQRRKPSAHVAAGQSADAVPHREQASAPSRPPENADDMSIMRELANLSVETALSSSARHRFSNVVQRELLLAATVLIAGVSAMWLSVPPRALWLTGALGCGLGTLMVIRGLKSLYLLRRHATPSPRAARTSSKSRK